MGLTSLKMVKCWRCGKEFNPSKPHYQEEYEGSCYMAWNALCNDCGKSLKDKFPIRKVKSCKYDE